MANRESGKDDTIEGAGQASPPPGRAPVGPPAEQDLGSRASDEIPQDSASIFAMAAEQEATPERPKAQFRELEDAGQWLEMLDRLEKQYERGDRALAAEEWGIALVALEEVAEIDPEFRDVQEKLAQAREENELATWYQEASTHAKASHWADACRSWAQVLRRRPDYRDSSALSGLLDAISRLLDG